MQVPWKRNKNEYAAEKGEDWEERIGVANYSHYEQQEAPRHLNVPYFQFFVNNAVKLNNGEDEALCVGLRLRNTPSSSIFGNAGTRDSEKLKVGEQWKLLHCAYKREPRV